ncbi:hypothetical protein B0H14DRAFT_2635299 [Mycena olivaceomarginata]|nr:hypothetical protein B0H14DRAFT_2635299 [Mycena olivaceomarginata]
MPCSTLIQTACITENQSVDSILSNWLCKTQMPLATQTLLTLRYIFQLDDTDLIQHWKKMNQVQPCLARTNSSKKQSCHATAATRKTHMHPNWNRVWSSTSQVDFKLPPHGTRFEVVFTPVSTCTTDSQNPARFDLNAIKFRTTTYIKIDYSTRQAHTRCWREAGPLGFMHRRTGLHRRAALRLAHRVRLGSAFSAIAAVRELMGVGQLAETRCALRVVHVLHPFDPPQHKSSSAHCASSARHALRRTATTQTCLGGGHGVRISTPDLGPALLRRRQMEEKGREKTERRDAVLSNAGVGSAAGVDLESVKKWKRHGSTALARLQCYKRSGLLARIVVGPATLGKRGKSQELDGRTNDRKSHRMTPPAKRGRERIRWGSHCSA